VLFKAPLKDSGDVERYFFRLMHVDMPLPDEAAEPTTDKKGAKTYP
jgi:hypothetical protein